MTPQTNLVVPLQCDHSKVELKNIIIASFLVETLTVDQCQKRLKSSFIIWLADVSSLSLVEGKTGSYFTHSLSLFLCSKFSVQGVEAYPSYDLFFEAQ